MLCLELAIPPLPQLTTVGHSFWKPGARHFRRSFQVYDMIIIKDGAFYMTEDDIPYELGPGGVLTLEPGRTHWGHRACEAETEIYWLHFIHRAPLRTVPSETVPWSFGLRQGTDVDLCPSEQFMYVPKFAHIDLQPIVPVLESMSALHRTLTVEHALPLHAELSLLFVKLQEAVCERYESRSAALCRRTIDYLRQHVADVFSAKQMEQALHFHFDYLSRCMKKHTGLSPLQFLQQHRVAMARTMLERTELTVREIGERVGMAGTNYFIRTFRKHVGIPPAQYRKRKQETL